MSSSAAKKKHFVWWSGLTWECMCGYITKSDSEAFKHQYDPKDSEA